MFLKNRIKYNLDANKTTAKSQIAHQPPAEQGVRVISSIASRFISSHRSLPNSGR